MKNLTKNRNAEFARRCIEIFEKDYRNGCVRPLDEVLAIALAMQPHSHYLSYDTASRKLHAIERHGIDALVTGENTRALYTELSEQVANVMRTRSQLGFDEALSFVLNFCRPSRFYMSLDTARRIIMPYLSYSICRLRG